MSERKNPFLGTWTCEKFISQGEEISDLAGGAWDFYDDDTFSFDEYNAGTFRIVDDKTIELTTKTPYSDSSHADLLEYVFERDGEWLILRQNGGMEEFTLRFEQYCQ